MATIETTIENYKETDQQVEPSAAVTDRPQTGRKRTRKSAADNAPSASNASAQRETERPRETKADLVLKKLRSAKGVTVETLMEATGWQAHSVRGFLSGTVKKKLGLSLISEAGKDGIRRYRIDATSRGE